MNQIESVTLEFGGSATDALGVAPDLKSANTVIQALRCYSRRSTRETIRVHQLVA